MLLKTNKTCLLALLRILGYHSKTFHWLYLYYRTAQLSAQGGEFYYVYFTIIKDKKKKNFFHWSTLYIRTVHLPVGMQPSEFPQSGHTHVTGTQIKKHNINPTNPHHVLHFQLQHLTSTTLG